MRQEILEKLWQHQLKILDEIDRICKKHGLQYFLMWGTLIGAIRHKGFIPWDDDIDISMPIKDYKKFLKIAQKEFNDEFFLQTSATDKYHPTYFAKVRLNNTAFYSKDDKNLKKHHGIFVDIIPLFNYDKKPFILTKIQRKIGERLISCVHGKREKINIGNRFVKKLPDGILFRLRDLFLNTKGQHFYSWGFYFDKSDFFPSKEIEFCGKKYPAPNEYDKVLRQIYGDYMQLPPEDKRVAHNPGRISFDTSLPDEEIF